MTLNLLDVTAHMETPLVSNLERAVLRGMRVVRRLPAQSVVAYAGQCADAYGWPVIAELMWMINAPH